MLREAASATARLMGKTGSNLVVGLESQAARASAQGTCALGVTGCTYPARRLSGLQLNLAGVGRSAAATSHARGCACAAKGSMFARSYAATTGAAFPDLPKVLKTDVHLAVPNVEAALRKRANLVITPDDEENTLLEQAQGAKLIMTCYGKITEKVIEAAGPSLKGIVKFGTGIDAIDIKAANRAGVPVANLPFYAEETVAEHAFALMMGLAKKLVPEAQTMQRDGWFWTTPEWRGSDLRGKTVCLVGFGRIGRVFARQCNAGFRMNVISYDPYVSAEEMARYGVVKVDGLHDALGRADVVSCHMVLNAETHHIMGEAELAAMRRHATIINVSRGALIDERALVSALKEGRIGGAGLDVFGHEPIGLSEDNFRSALLKMDNVICTPHTAFYTQECLDRLETETLERCLECLDDLPLTVMSKDPRLQQQPHIVLKHAA